MASKPQVIALEEHYLDPEVKRHIDRPRRAPARRASPRGSTMSAQLPHRGDGRGRHRHAGAVARRAVGAEGRRRDRRCALARGANDRLHETVRAHPDRFAAFAALPTADPKAAADELERAVTKLGFKGAMVHGLTNGLFLDDKRFWPIFERAQALDVPLYMHPSIPHPAVIEAYYKDYVEQIPDHAARRLGLYGRDRDAGHPPRAERRVRRLSRAQDHPRPSRRGAAVLSVAHQHGAGARRRAAPTWFRDVFCEHFWITTSGFFSDPALLCCIQEMGIDRILFSVDYPFVENPPGTEWAATACRSAPRTRPRS